MKEKHFLLSSRLLQSKWIRNTVGLECKISVTFLTEGSKLYNPDVKS